VSTCMCPQPIGFLPHFFVMNQFLFADCIDVAMGY
jgi:hypothetical protein